MKHKLVAWALIGAVALTGGIGFAGQKSNPNKTMKQVAINAHPVKLTKVQALEIAKQQAGVKEVSKFVIKMELDEGRIEYDVEIHAGGFKYEYDIDANTGQVWEESVEDNRTVKPPAKPQTNPQTGSGQPTNRLTPEQALEIVKKHAGFKTVTDAAVKIEYDDGREEYDVEFRVDSIKYEYDVDVYSGKIWEESIDIDDDDDRPLPSAPAAPAAQILTRDQALAIALKDAGVAKYHDLDVELDEDDGVRTYEIDFESGRFDYEYKIDANTGAILSKEID